MRNAKQRVDNIFRAMLNYIEAMTVVSDNPIFKEFVKELNVVSERYRLILAQQKGKANAKKEKLAEAEAQIAEAEAKNIVSEKIYNIKQQEDGSINVTTAINNNNKNDGPEATVELPAKR